MFTPQYVKYVGKTPLNEMRWTGRDKVWQNGQTELVDQAIVALLFRAISGVGQWVAGDPNYIAPPSTVGTPAYSYAFAVRASQPGYDVLLDQSPRGNAFLSKAGLYASAFTPTTALALNAVRAPTPLNGLLAVVTTAGTTGATEPAWSSTVGATVTSGTVTFTMAKGPYFNDASGTKLFRSLQSATQLAAHQSADMNVWNGARDSFILCLAPKIDYNATGQALGVLFSTSLNGTGPGFRVLGTGGSVQDIRVQYWTASGQVLSDDTSPGYPRRPLDGQQRYVMIAYDAPTRTGYYFGDGVALTQLDMNSGSGLCPNGLNLGSLTNWADSSGLPTIGGDPGSSTSSEFALKQVDYLVLKNRGLPANIQAIASYKANGGEGLIYESMMAG